MYNDDDEYEQAKKIVPGITYEEYRDIDELARETVRWLMSMSQEERNELMGRR